MALVAFAPSKWRSLRGGQSVPLLQLFPDKEGFGQRRLHGLFAGNPHGARARFFARAARSRGFQPYVESLFGSLLPQARLPDVLNTSSPPIFGSSKPPHSSATASGDDRLD